MPSQVVRHVDTNEKLIALTFDDEGRPARVDAILEALGEADVKATMFLNGSWVTRNKETVLRMSREGHEIANHSYTHRSFTILSPAEIQRELKRTQDAIASAGVTPSRLFRPPYGSFNAKVLSVTESAGFPYAILWSIDTKDWEGRSASVITNTVLSRAKPGDIVLFHLHGRNTAASLPGIIRELRNRGFNFVTVSQLIARGTPVSAWRQPEARDL
jgi:peptidoglycan/xylan/chitin deacetylase (PgdA/CDA1 family)